MHPVSAAFAGRVIATPGCATAAGASVRGMLPSELGRRPRRRLSLPLPSVGEALALVALCLSVAALVLSLLAFSRSRRCMPVVYPPYACPMLAVPSPGPGMSVPCRAPAYQKTNGCAQLLPGVEGAKAASAGVSAPASTVAAPGAGSGTSTLPPTR